MLLVKDQPRLRKWLWARIPDGPPLEEVTCIGWVGSGGDLLAVVGYSHHDEVAKTLCMHIAGTDHKNWLSRQLLNFMFMYPFCQLEVELIYAPVSIHNERCLRFVKHIGFKEHEVNLEKSYSLLTLSKKDCKYIEFKEVRNG